MPNANRPCDSKPLKRAVVDPLPAVGAELPDGAVGGIGKGRARGFFSASPSPAPDGALTNPRPRLPDRLRPQAASCLRVEVVRILGYPLRKAQIGLTELTQELLSLEVLWRWPVLIYR
jgi:hypothetical protein